MRNRIGPAAGHIGRFLIGAEGDSGGNLSKARVLLRAQNKGASDFRVGHIEHLKCVIVAAGHVEGLAVFGECQSTGLPSRLHFAHRQARGV